MRFRNLRTGFLMFIVGIICFHWGLLFGHRWHTQNIKNKRQWIPNVPASTGFGMDPNIDRPRGVYVRSNITSNLTSSLTSTVILPNSFLQRTDTVIQPTEAGSTIRLWKASIQSLAQPQIASSEAPNQRRGPKTDKCFQRFHFQKGSAKQLWDSLDQFSGSRECPALVSIHGYACHGFGNRPCDSQFERLTQRDDILWVNYDLGDHNIAHDYHSLRGVTEAPPRFFKKALPVIDSDRPIRLSFSGHCQYGWAEGSHVRPALRRLVVGKWAKKGTEIATEGLYQTNEVFFHCVSSRSTPKEKIKFDYSDYDTMLLKSRFALCPHGDGRWSFRLSEVIGAGAIPVVLADGLTLPYSQIIDWSKAAVILPERLIDQLIESGNNVTGLLALLPNMTVALAMSAEVRRINQHYFETSKKRDAALLASAIVESRSVPGAMFTASCSPAECGSSAEFIPPTG